MKQTTKQLPFFVYGTLMTGFGNNRIIKDLTDRVEQGELDNAQIHPVMPHGGFPCMTRGVGIVTGEIVYMKPESYDIALQQMDALEGYRKSNPIGSMYIRETALIRNDEGQLIKCYVYRWNREAENEKIKSGCWRTFHKELTRI